MSDDPEVNTQNFDIHCERLNKYKRSRYNGEMEYMGPRGGIYTISASGKRNYI